MGYGGMLIPLVSTLVAITLLPGRAGEVRRAARLAAPAHATTRRAAPGRAGPRPSSRRRWLAAGAGMAVILALVVRRDRPPARHLATPTRSPRRATPSEGLDALEDSGHRRRARCCRTRSWSTAAPTPTQVAATLRGSRASTAPSRPTTRVARDGTAIVEAFPIPDSGTPEGEARSTACATPRTRPARTCASAASRRANADFIDAVYGSFPLMIALIAIIDVHPAGAGVPLAAAAARRRSC